MNKIPLGDLRSLKYLTNRTLSSTAEVAAAVPPLSKKSLLAAVRPGAEGLASFMSLVT